MSRFQALGSLASLAQPQHGLVTAGQAMDAGVSGEDLDRLVEEAGLTVVADGVYQVDPNVAPAFVDVWAAWLQLDPERTATARLEGGRVDAVVSHFTAADVHGLGTLESEWITFTTNGSVATSNPDVKVYADSFEPSDWALVDGLPVMKPLRVVAELAKDDCEASYLAAIVLDVLQRGLSERGTLASVLEPYATAYGVQGGGAPFLDRLLGTAASGFQS